MNRCVTCVLKVFAAAASIAPIAGATTWVSQPVEYYFEGAEIVARVFITKAELQTARFKKETVGCGEVVEADVIELFKGDAEQVRFLIRGMLLDVGSEYFVYLERASSVTPTPMMSTNSVSQAHDSLVAAACKSRPAEFEANWLSTSALLPRYRNQQTEMWIEPAYNIAVPDAAGVLFRQVELRSLNVDGEVVQRDFWDWSDPPMPFEFWMYDGAFQWDSYRKFLLAAFKKPKQDRARQAMPQAAGNTLGGREQGSVPAPASAPDHGGVASSAS